MALIDSAAEDEAGVDEGEGKMRTRVRLMERMVKLLCGDGVVERG